MKKTAIMTLIVGISVVHGTTSAYLDDVDGKKMLISAGVGFLVGASVNVAFQTVCAIAWDMRRTTLRKNAAAREAIKSGNSEVHAKLRERLFLELKDFERSFDAHTGLTVNDDFLPALQYYHDRELACIEKRLQSVQRPLRDIIFGGFGGATIGALIAMRSD